MNIINDIERFHELPNTHLRWEQGGAALAKSWFMSHTSMDISTINHSYGNNKLIYLNMGHHLV